MEDLPHDPAPLGREELETRYRELMQRLSTLHNENERLVCLSVPLSRFPCGTKGGCTGRKTRGERLWGRETDAFDDNDDNDDDAEKEPRCDRAGGRVHRE